MGKDNSLDSLRDRIKNSTKSRSGLTVWKAPQSTSTEQTSTQRTDPIRDRIKNSTKKSDTTKLKVSDSLGTFDIGPKLVYAPEDQKAASQSTPLNLQYKLLGIGGELDRGEREVQQAVDRFNADPSEENRQTVKNLLATYQTNLDAYKSTVDEYNHYYSMDGYKERAEAQDKEVKALTEERDKLKMYLDGVQSGTWVPDQAFLDRVSGGKPLDEALAEVQNRLDTATEKSNKDSEAYVLESAKAEYDRLNNSTDALRLYRTIQTTTSPENAVRRMIAILDSGGEPEDDPSALAQIKKQLGLSPENSGGTAQYMNDLRDALPKAEQEANLSEAALEKFSELGFDYDQIRWYEQYKSQEQTYWDNIAKWEAYAKEHPVAASAVSVLAAPVQGAEFLDQVLRGVGHSDPGNLDTFRPASAGGMSVTTFVNTVRGTVSKELEEKYDWELWGQNVASFLYNTGMSMADSAFQITTLGPAATIFMGGAAAASTAQSVIERGGSNRQAFSAGLAAGVAEAFFEKFSVDRLRVPKTPQGVKGWIKEAMAQGGVEASEEMLTEVSNIISDALILGELSENKGKSLAELIAQIGWAGAGGFLSGATMTTGRNAPRAAIQQVQVWAHDNMAGRQLKQASVNFSMVEQALSYAEDSETYRMASDMAQRLNASTAEGADNILRAVTDAEYGRLARSMTAELETKGPAGVQNQVEAAQAARPEEKVASPTMQAFLEAGDTAADAEVKAGVLDRILAGDTTLTNTQLRKLKLNTQASRMVFEKLTGVSVPKSADTKTLIETARSAAEQAVARKASAVSAAAQTETPVQTGGEAVSSDSAAAAWRGAPNPEQSQESFMTQLEQEAAMAAQEAETKSSPNVEPAAAFMPEGSAQSSASLLGQLEQEAAEIARDAEVKSSRTSEPASAFIPEGVTGREDRSDMRRARVVPQEQAQGKRGKSRGRRYAATESRTQSDTVSQAMESTTERKPTQEQEWTAKYATAMLRGTSVKNVRVAFEGFSGQENAYYQDGEIVLNGNRLTTQRAINYILGHELTHPGADADAGLVQSILDLGDRLHGEGVMSTRLSMTRERYIRSYMRNHGMSRTQAEAKVTLKLAKEETAADLMSELFAAPGALERMGRESTGAKVLRAARDALNRMLSKLTGKGSQSARNEAEMLLERLNRALRSQESRGTMEQKEARSSVGRETDSPDYRGRQDAGRAGGGGQVRGEYRTAREGTGRDGRGDLGVLERALIPSDVRAAAEQNDFPNLELREILDPAAFSDALERAKAANPNGGMVDSQSVEHLDETRARTFMREDGLAGVAVEADGNIVGVFKHPDFKQRKVVKDLLLTAIAQGGTHLDCYVTGGKHDLASKYTQMGFVPVAWLAFNREYAPDGWNYEAWGEPDVVMWVHSGETALEVAQRSGTYPFFSTEYIHSLPQFDDYDAAKELQAQKVKEITEARKAGRRYSIGSEQPFSEQVDRALTEDLAENWNRALYIRETPITLRGIGLGDLPMTITAKHVQNINHTEDPSGQHPEWHGIDQATIARLPQLLERPVVIMDSATVPGDIVVVVSEVDDQGRPIVVSIRPNGTAKVDEQRGPSNFITSVYGRNGYAAWVNQAVRDGRVLYWNKNRSQNLSGKARVQFPAGLTGLASNTIIKRHAGYVKDNIPERRFSVDMDSEGQWLSDEQKEFFKDSKAVDEDGNLLLMYHGTNADKNFTRFDTYGGHFGLFGLGSYFTDNRSVADSYTAKGRGTNPRVYEVYLNIKNPLDMDAPFRPEEWSDVDPDILDYFRDARTNEDMFRGLKEYCQDEMMYRDEAEEFITDFIIERGYDGITHIGGGRYGSKDGPRHRVFIAFEPEQIKSANNRTPTDDPDIRYSISDEERVFITPRGIEVVKNPTSTEYQQMRDEIYDAFPWLRGTGEPVLRHTYDEEGNEYYWRADQGLHSQVEPYINRHYHTRTSQQWQWWLSPHKDEYPTDYDRRFSVGTPTAEELSDVNTRYSIRELPPPKKTGIAYKVFYAKDGQLYPPMVANPGGAGTPVGVWLDADIGQSAPPSKTGRMQVQAGGKGTNAAKGSLAFRPGWHLGDIPLAKQFARKNPETGVKDLFPSDFVWAECEYAMDVDYQDEAMSYGYTDNGKFRHSYAGLPKLPADGYYRYRTNPNPDTVPWIITGAMRVKRILTDAETDAICRAAGVEPMQRQGGPMDAAKLEKLGLKAGNVDMDGPDTRYSVSDEDINPDTGYRRGSIEDSFMRIVNAGDEQRALDMLQSMLERMAAFEATRAERSNPADAFMPKPELTDDLVAKNRAAIQALIDKYGRMEQTKAAARRVNFPNQIDDDTKVRGVVRTAASAKATPEALVSEFERSILDGDAGYTYVPISDKSVLDKIKGRIEQRGFSAELREWRAAIDSNKSMTKEDIARGEQLYVEACANKDLETAQQLVAELAMIGTQYGQVIQAISMLHKLSPTGQLYYLQKTVEHMTREYDKLGKDIDVLMDPELAKQLLEAGTKEEIDVAMDQIIADIARQLPVTIWDKWDAWRYLAMLGNPTTHIRNMLSNAVFTPVRMTKDLVGIALETMFIRDRGQRTKGFATKEAREFAKADALVMKDILRTGGKHNITDRIRDAKRIFKIMPLEWARTKNTAALETEDWWTMQGAYIRALSGFLSVRGADLSTLQGEGETREGRRLLNEARAYAVREAQKATYRDMNTMASILNQFRRAKNPFVRFAFGGLLPFTKTPFNIVRRGVEYSPIGLVGTIRTAMKGGSSAEILDRLSASFTGTGLLVAGYFLAKAGLLIGGMGDDPEDEFQELQGIQPYSFQIGDRSYTIDWLAPTVLPLFVGAELHRMTNGEVEAEDAYEAMMTILGPVMALSMMSGLNDTLSAVRYEDQDEMIVAMLRNMVGSYFTQGVPTILGRVARTMDDSRRTSFVSADATPTESWLSRTFQSSVLGKIPVAAERRMLYIDAWGRADTEENAGFRALENFLSPGYYNSIQTTAVDEELMRLAKATNSTAVFPKRAEKSFTVDGEAYAMTQEEYQKHLIERGQTSYQLVSDLISSPTYAGMSDKEKARAVEKCYDYAAQLAKLHTNNDYGVSPWVVKLEQMTGEGLDADDYFTAYAMSEEEDRNMKEIISSTDRYDGATAALLMAMDFNASDFTDPYAKGYEYKLTDGQRDTYRGLFVERLSSELSYLMSDDWYLDASVEERLEMLDETWSDTLDEVKRDMADWLWDHGIESTEKE